MLLRGSVQPSHTKGWHEVGESVPGATVLPFSAQGVQVALEVAPRAWEKVFLRQGVHSEAPGASA